MSNLPTSGITMRPAFYSDNKALVQIVRLSPIETDSEVIIFDRSPNFFAQLQLQGNGQALVADAAGELVGCGLFAYYETLIKGQQTKISRPDRT